MDKKIKGLLRMLRAAGRGRAIGFTIGTTRGAFSGSWYATPLRQSGELVYAGVIVRDAKTAKKIARLIDGKVRYVFVDAERKVADIERAVTHAITRSTLITYKGNDLAAQAVDALVARLVPRVSRSTVALIGLGNLGSKVALNLLERGARVQAYRPERAVLKKIVAGLGHMKPKRSASRITAARSVRDACKGANIVIACANAKGIVDERALAALRKSPAPVLVDVGKGCFSDSVVANDANLIYRLDISIIQKHALSALIETARHYAGPLGRRTLKDKKGTQLVSLGILARKGETIVDDLKKPTRVIGIADGWGSLLESKVK